MILRFWEKLVDLFRGLTPRTRFKSEESAETSLSRAIFANALQLLVIYHSLLKKHLDSSIEKVDLRPEYGSHFVSIHPTDPSGDAFQADKYIC